MRTDHDFTGLVAFARSVEDGSFTAAGRRLGATPSAVSPAVARLEARLGVALVKRSTRSLVLTPEGRAYFELISPALATLAAAEGAVGDAEARGVVRLSVPIDFGRGVLAAAASRFVARYPAVVLELNVTDRLVDVRREDIDVALRIGSPPPPGLGSVQLGTIGYAVVASPDYLARRGVPRTPANLAEHACLQYLTLEGRPLPWRLDGVDIATSGPLATDDGGALRTAALAGAGIAHLFRLAVAHDVASGHLVELFPDAETAELPVAAFHPFGRFLPNRVLATLTFLQEELERLEEP